MDALDTRVLILAATARDASLARDALLSAGLEPVVCQTFDDLLARMREGTAAVLIVEERLSAANTGAMARCLREQPPWSDLPVLILARPGADSAELGLAVRSLGNVTLLERPLRVVTLLSAIRTAVRARSRQYQIRSHLSERARSEELLRQSDQRKDEFLATLGHELRNPLSPLSAGLQLLKATGQPDRVVALMERQVGHLTRMVDDLLEVSRITRGLIEVRREPVDLAFILQSAVEASRPAVDAAGHELRVELPEEPIIVDGDGVRLTQVFANLIGNAVKYTSTGGRIRLTAHRAADRAVVTVRDTGIGIPADQLEAVFDMFTQVDRSSRSSQGGLGIGLTLVRSLVAMHGGRVEARSGGAGCGSEFVVELPAAAATGVEAREMSEIGRFPPRRILVVDDNVDAADALGALLETLGATVAVSHGGREAIECVERFKPEVVLLDIGMPGMDGYEVARRLRASSGPDGLLLVALTGWGQEQDRERSRAAGFDHHLIKPPNLDALRDVLMDRWEDAP